MLHYARMIIVGRDTIFVSTGLVVLLQSSVTMTIAIKGMTEEPQNCRELRITGFLDFVHRPEL
jgi:hypothetical protein